MTNPVLDTALTLVRAGVSVIPIGAHKRPAIETWKGYQDRLPTLEEWIAWAASRRCGLTVVLGPVSENAEAIDFDDLSVLRPWYDLVEAMAPGLIARLVTVETPTHGRHLYYRCPVIEGNQKLAVNAQRQTMIETRGAGGYTLIPSSPAWCHPENKPYVPRQGDLAAISTITATERDIMLHCARALTQYVEPERVYTPRERRTAPGDRPVDRFAANVAWEDILIPHGWRVVGHRGEVTLWCRPGKNHGISATTGHYGDYFYIFSSNAYPFAPWCAYSKFAAFTLLNTGGDFIKAAAMLAHQGYVTGHAGQTMASNQYFEGFQGFKGYRGDRGSQAKGAM
jgi:Bifunctional DNA primase/polymerase, N-terminal